MLIVVLYQRIKTKQEIKNYLVFDIESNAKA
jgi:hypothetical protein